MTDKRREYDEDIFRDHLREERMEETFPEALPEEVWLNIMNRIPAWKLNNTNRRLYWLGFVVLISGMVGLWSIAGTPKHGHF